MTKLTNEEALQRGQRAAAILNDPMVVDVLAQIEARYLALWRRPQTENSQAEREHSWAMIQHLDLFRGFFETYIRTGQVAAAKIKEAAQQKVGTSEP